MRLVTQLHLSAGLLLAIALAATAMTVWNVRQASYHVDRANFAHQQYEAYLSLSKHTYQLYKQFADGLVGVGGPSDAQPALVDELGADLDRLRGLTGREIDFVSDEEVEEELEELERLARIERQVGVVLDGYRSAVGAGSRAPAREEWQQLSLALGVAIADLDRLIDDALADEASEVGETRAIVGERMARYRLVAILFALVASVAALLALHRLVHNIRAPVGNLLDGVAALRRGRLGHRVDATGPPELAALATAFNAMADEIASREAALSRAKADLEQAVSERTEELTRALETVRESEANRRRLLADVSHELRTPLTIIRGEADIALRGERKPPEVYREALARCRESAEHTSRLVDDLLFVARNESGEVRLSLRELDLGPLVASVAQECRSLAGTERASIAFEPPAAPIVARAEEQRIRQVLLILIENAVRYGGATIDIRIDAHRDGHRIAVHDDGPGMSELEKASAFDRFFRGTNAAERYGGGAGLGLPVARAIVEAHGGTIGFDDAAQEGLTVAFTLPGRPRLQAVS